MGLWQCTWLLAFYLLASVRYVPTDRVGIVEKRFSLSGSIERGVIARHGEAGFQPSVLRGGVHFLWAIQYVVHRVPLVTIW